MDFSSPIGKSSFVILVPLRHQDNWFSFLDPLSLEVWICFLICIPVYIWVIISMNYLFSGSSNWEPVASSVIRAALSERNKRLPPKHHYQKLLAIVWPFMMLVLTTSYKGTLLAMITKPTISMPFTDADGMVQQTKIKWGYWKNDVLFDSYTKSKSQGTTIRRINSNQMF